MRDPRDVPTHTADDLFTWREKAEARRDLGIERSAAHAERVEPGWSDDALDTLRAFLAEQGDRPFLAEEFRAWATRLAPPPDARAFGAVFKRAATGRLIVRIGYAPSNSSNRAPMCLWRAAR